ncbi:hypothetical protein, partial [Klebsiella aerogenes]|uniref:hypothetical protein n=1 Tax=Klebsiella aerogenes TaxID=548 RepID=UPI001954DF4B
LRLISIALAMGSGMMKYEVVVTSIGDMATELMESTGDLIIFDTCPLDGLAEISIMHTTASSK